MRCRTTNSDLLRGVVERQPSAYDGPEKSGPSSIVVFGGDWGGFVDMYGAWIHLYNGWWILRRKNGEMVLGRRCRSHRRAGAAARRRATVSRSPRSPVGCWWPRETRGATPHVARHLTVKGSRLNELSLEMLGRARPPARRSNGLHGVVRCFTATRQVGRNPSGGGPSMMATYDVSLRSQPTDTYTQRRFELRISTHFKTRTGCQRLSRHTHAFEFSFTGYIK